LFILWNWRTFAQEKAAEERIRQRIDWLNGAHPRLELA